MTIQVVAGVIRRDGRVLICQRKPGGQFPGKWEFPGGKIEPEEVPRIALRRELFEELAIDATIGREIWRTEHQYPGHPPVSLIFFEILQYKGTPQNNAFQQVLWAEPVDLTRYDFLEADRALIEHLAMGPK